MPDDTELGGSSRDRYSELQATDDFQRLRRTFRGFVFPMTAFFLVWYFLYVFLSVFASDFMAKEVFGRVNIGILFGFGQFLTTFVITFMYARWANRKFDPLADELGARLDGHKGH